MKKFNMEKIMKNKLRIFFSIVLLVILAIQLSACFIENQSHLSSWKPYKVEYHDTYYSVEKWNNTFKETINITSIDLNNNGNGKVFSAIYDFSQTIESNCSWTKSGNKITLTGDGFMWIELHQVDDFLTQTLNMNDKSIILYYKKYQ